MPKHNTDGIINCLGSPDGLSMTPKVYASIFSSTYYVFRYHDSSCYRDRVSGAAGQRSVAKVFAKPSGQFCHDETNTESLP